METPAVVPFVPLPSVPTPHALFTLVNVHLHGAATACIPAERHCFRNAAVVFAFPHIKRRRCMTVRQVRSMVYADGAHSMKNLWCRYYERPAATSTSFRLLHRRWGTPRRCHSSPIPRALSDWRCWDCCSFHLVCVCHRLHCLSSTLDAFIWFARAATHSPRFFFCAAVSAYALPLTR